MSVGLRALRGGLAFVSHVDLEPVRSERKVQEGMGVASPRPLVGQQHAANARGPWTHTVGKGGTGGMGAGKG